MWSPDLTPPSSGLPDQAGEFELLLQVKLATEGIAEEPVYSVRVCTPRALAETPDGRFVQCTLVLREFSWRAVADRIETLLRHCESCKNWNDVESVLAGYLANNDAARLNGRGDR
jgi:hypothetical protein